MTIEYQQLFKEGLQLLMATDIAKGDTTRLPQIMETLAKLEDPNVDAFSFGASNEPT